MKVAVASGKGGTGKTTIAVNLACSLCEPVQLLDCDVEEPNCHIFLKPTIKRREAIGVPVPVVDESKCTVCGECSEMCQYHAIASLKTGVLIFPELCHGCGGCAKVCPAGAIIEVQREIGVVETGARGRVEFVHGRLNIGQARSVPLIRAVKRHSKADGVTIIDCPPGTSCPVIAALKDVDFVVLVTEPTPFGLYDLTLAAETVRQLGIPFGVVINRADVGDARVADYCRYERIPVLLQIPDDRRIAVAYSRGQLVVEALPELRAEFMQLHANIGEFMRPEPASTAGRCASANL